MTCAFFFFPFFFFLQSRSFIFFTPIMLRIHREWAPSNSSGSFALVLTKCASPGAAGWSFSWTQVPFSLASFFFWSFSFLHTFREAVSALSVLNMLNTRISLGKNFARYVRGEMVVKMGSRRNGGIWEGSYERKRFKKDFQISEMGN